MTQYLIAAGLVLFAAVAALVIRRRTEVEGPVSGRSWPVPAQLHRDDFEHPSAPWLVVLFSSATCDSCASTWTKILPLESDEVAVQDVPFQTHRELHDRYRIEAVPTVVIADDEGVVRGSFLGPVTTAELWAVVADLRAQD